MLLLLVAISVYLVFCGRAAVGAIGMDERRDDPITSLYWWVSVVLRFRMNAMLRTQSGCTCAVLAGFWLGLTSGGSAYSQASAGDAGGAIDLGARGGTVGEASLRAAGTQDRQDSPVEFNFRAGFATDYIYRGTTLSAHQPAVGAAFEAAFGSFYGGGTIASVKLPSQPAAEVSIVGGVRIGIVTVETAVTTSCGDKRAGVSASGGSSIREIVAVDRRSSE